MSHYPFRDLAYRDAPTQAHFESRQFFAVNHVPYSLDREIQQFSGLTRSQPRYRVKSLLHSQALGTKTAK
jgi:hypothetical protein